MLQCGAAVQLWRAGQAGSLLREQPGWLYLSAAAIDSERGCWFDDARVGVSEEPWDLAAAAAAAR